jgi:hypothetical protein
MSTFLTVMKLDAKLKGQQRGRHRPARLETRLVVRPAWAFRKSSGSLAMLVAIRRASSLVSSLAAG